MMNLSRFDPGHAASEHLQQAHFVSWWRKTQPDTLFAIPNGGMRNKVLARKLKAEGVLAGVLDMLAPDRRLWIEMKRANGGTLSPEQKVFAMDRIAAGDRVIVAWGALDAIDQVLHGERQQWTRPK